MKETKLIAIGDLHGRSCWQHLAFDRYDVIIFLGDYVDSAQYSDRQILKNFETVVAFKKSLPHKVILLLGNHDIQYLHFPKYPCSGFNPGLQETLTRIFTENKNLFQVAYQIKSHLFSHAGLSQPWYEKFISLVPDPVQKKPGGHDTLSHTLNAVERSDHRDVLHQVGVRRGGSEGFGGLTWADKEELWNYPLEGYHQVVGHTPVPFIEAISYNENTSVTFVDVLGSQEAYLELSVAR